MGSACEHVYTGANVEALEDACILFCALAGIFLPHFVDFYSLLILASCLHLVASFLFSALLTMNERVESLWPVGWL